MLTFILSGTTSSNKSLGDASLVLLIGMAVIFLVLVIIIFTVKGYCGFFALTDKKKAKKKEDAVTEEKQVAPPPVATVNADTELVAVITAAITMMYETQTEDGEVPPFRVKSIILK